MLVLASQLTELGLAEGAHRHRDGLPAGGRFLCVCRRRCRADDSRRASTLLARLRQIKTADEIALLRTLSRIADQAITDALMAVEAGDTEMDLAAASHAQYLCARSGAVQADDRRDRRAKQIAERRSERAAAPTRRRLSCRDLLGHRRLSGRRVPDGGRRRRRRRKRRRSGSTSSIANTRSWRWSGPVQAAGRSTRRSSQACRINLPPISFVGSRDRTPPPRGPVSRPDAHPWSAGERCPPVENGMVLGFEPLCYETALASGMQNKDMLLVTETGFDLLSDYTEIADKLIVVQ